MTQDSNDAVLGAAAKKLAWELYAAAGYSRVRTSVNVPRFERELLSAMRQWKATRNNLKNEKTERSRKNGTDKH